MTDNRELSLLDSLKHKIQILEDKEAIRDVLSRYALNADLKHFEGFVNLFMPAGVFITDGSGTSIRRTGKEEIRTVLHSMPGGVATQHLQLDYIIDVYGDAATATGYQLITETKDTESRIGRCALRQFRFRRIEGNWLIEEAISRAITNVAECEKLAREVTKNQT